MKGLSSESSPGAGRGLGHVAALAAACCLLVLSAAALASELAEQVLFSEGVEALRAWRVAQARGCAEQLLRERPDSAAGHNLAAQAAFMEGDYAACRRHLAVLAAQGVEVPGEIAAIVERLEPVYESFQERRSEHFRFRWSHPADAVLALYALPVLERALDIIGGALGYRHEGGRIAVEIYPDMESFAAASTLSMEEIRTTGAAAICKFNRLMLASPRLYLQGYRWCDTLAHELTHYIIIKKTGNRVPVWLHEGIAKYYERRWRLASDEPGLRPLQSTLLAEARRGGRFIPLERMHPSLARLKSQEEAALAFAEVTSFILFLRERAGSDAVSRVLEGVAGGAEVPDALARVAGCPFDEFLRQWRDWLGSLPLRSIPGLRIFPRRLNEGADNAERAADLAGVLPQEAYRFARLGDMLRDEARHAAAAIEYRKAAAATSYLSPHLQVRLAHALMASGALEEAQETLDAVAAYYPDYMPLYVAMGELCMRRGDERGAAKAMTQAVQINPFDPRPHELLAELYRRSGDAGAREREESALKVIFEWLGG